MLRPLPPFRAKPARKAQPPKHLGRDSRKDGPTVTVKAQRHPIKIARVTAAPALKVLSRSTVCAST